MQEKEFLQKVMQDHELQQQFKALNAKGDQKSIENLAKNQGFNCSYAQIVDEMQKLDEKELNMVGGIDGPVDYYKGKHEYDSGGQEIE